MTEQPTTGPDDQLAVESLRTLIATELAALNTLLPNVVDLIDSHQRGLGFMTVEGRKVMDNLVRKEREARAWNLVHSGVKITGDVPAPGNINAYAITAEAHLVLGDIVRDLTRRLRKLGVCLIANFPLDPTTEQLTHEVQRLTGIIVRVTVLDNILRRVQELTDKARRLVEGDDKKRHPKPCPHCGRDTLVTYISKGIIRCEQDPQTGQYEWCRCTDAFCPCIRHPKDHRHEWHRKPATKLEKSWWNLKDAQTLAERNTDKQGAQA